MRGKYATAGSIQRLVESQHACRDLGMGKAVEDSVGRGGSAMYVAVENVVVVCCRGHSPGECGSGDSGATLGCKNVSWVEKRVLPW